MKTEIEVYDGCLTVSTVDGSMMVAIDVVTGEIQEIDFTEATIHQLAAFITKAKTRYNKFLSSKAIDDFIR